MAPVVRTVDPSKPSDRRQADQAKVTLDIKPTRAITPAWCRLWQLLLSSGPGPAGKEGNDNAQLCDSRQEVGKNGEADPQAKEQ